MEDEIKNNTRNVEQWREEKKRMENRRVNIKYNMTWKIWKIKTDRVKRENGVLKNWKKTINDLKR